MPCSASQDARLFRHVACDAGEIGWLDAEIREFRAAHQVEDCNAPALIRVERARPGEQFGQDTHGSSPRFRSSHDDHAIAMAYRAAENLQTTHAAAVLKGNLY
jgi:hypothetical protein